MESLGIGALNLKDEDREKLNQYIAVCNMEIYYPMVILPVLSFYTRYIQAHLFRTDFLSKMLSAKEKCPVIQSLWGII
jgi:hypothetical protein